MLKKLISIGCILLLLSQSIMVFAANDVLEKYTEEDFKTFCNDTTEYSESAELAPFSELSTLYLEVERYTTDKSEVYTEIVELKAGYMEYRQNVISLKVMNPEDFEYIYMGYVDESGTFVGPTEREENSFTFPESYEGEIRCIIRVKPNELRKEYVSSLITSAESSITETEYTQLEGG